MSEGSRIRKEAAVDREKDYCEALPRDVCTGGSLRAWNDPEMFQSHRVEQALGPGASRLSQHGSCNDCQRRPTPELQFGMQRPSDLEVVAV